MADTRIINLSALRRYHKTLLTMIPEFLPLSDDIPEAAKSSGSAGTSAECARSDHSHPLQTSVSGNAGTATKLAASRSINISDADGTNTGTAISFDGTQNGTIKLPATIKATLTGNASSADSVPWSGITSKPSSFTPSAHNQASSTINAMTGYSKPSSTSAIGTSDTLNSAIGKLEKALDGKQASGSYAAASHNHDASNINSGTLNVARIPDLDASKITSGTIDVARLPAGALPILKIVGNETERFALTSSDVQVGDTVQQTDTGLMYYVKDVSKLNSADGYAVYTAGAATSVPWSGVTSKPSTFAPSAHNQASNTINAMTGYSKPSSTSAIGTSDTLNAAIGKLEKALDGKQASGSYAAASHNQASSTINAMTGYSKPSSTSAIGTSDTLNAAIGKLEKALDGKAGSSHNQASSTINAMTGYSKPSSTSAIGTSDTLNAAIGKLEKALDGKANSGTSLSDYGIADAKIASGTITLGSSSITPLTSSSSLNAAKLTGTAAVDTTGNAGTATKFASAQSVALTGAVTGTASSQAGWSVSTIWRSCMVGQSGSTSTNPWYKVATFAVTTANDDIMATFLVEDTYSSHKQGILKVHVRTDGSKVISSTASDLIWLSHTGFTLGDFVLVCPTAASSTAELWTKIATGYMYRRFTVLSEGSRSSTATRWTLLNAASAGQAASITTTGTQIQSVLSGQSASSTGNAATVTGTAGTSTLAWGSEVTLYTVGGHAIKAKLPSNPNTDVKVKQYEGTTNTERPILSRYSADEATQTANYVVYDTGVTSNPNKHTLTASGGFLGKLTGTPEGTTYVAAATAGNALVTSNATAFGALFNAPTKNYRVALSTWPSNGDGVILYSVSKDNVAAGTNTTNKSLTWNADSGTLTATAFSGPLTGNVTGNVSGSSGSCTGNAATATTLKTARTINGVSFDGSANITVADSTKLPLAGGTLTGTLTMSSAGTLINRHHTEVVKGTNPSASKYWNINQFESSGTAEKNRVTCLENRVEKTGLTGAVLRAYAFTKDSTTNAALGVYYDTANSLAYTYAPNPPAGDNTNKIATTSWVNTKAGSYLPLAGGTMTGNITMSASKSIIFDLSATTPTVNTTRNFPIQFKSQSTAGDYAFAQNPFFEIPLAQTTNYGMGIGFSGSGLTIIGGGEAGRGIVAAEELNGGTEKIILASDGAIDIYTNCNTIADRVKTSIDTSGNFTGNASTATKLKTARNLYANLGSVYDSSNPVTFDGSANKALPVTGTLGLANGGTGATTRLNALKTLTNENVGTGANYFLTITSSWGKGGYTSVADAKTVLGLGSAAYTASTDYATSGHTHSYVPLAGGTMTGNLTVAKSGPVVCTKSTGMTRNTAPSAAVNTVEILGQDNAGKSTWGIYHTYGTDMANRAQLIAYNGKSTDNTWSGIGIGYDASGNVSTNAPTPAFGDNTTKIATTAFVYSNAAKHFAAAQTIYVAKAATGNGSGSSTSNYMSLADLRNYLATVHMHSSTADLSGSYSVTLLFKAGDSFGNATFDSNKLPGIRSIVINTSTGTASTTSNYSTNSPTFGNITVTGNISATIRNVNCTGAISAQYGSYVLIDTYVAAAKLQASNHGYLNIAKNMIIDVVDAHTDYFVVATSYGLVAMWPGATVTLNFRNQCYYSRTLFCASTNGTLWLGYSSFKLTGTKPVSLWSGSGTLKGTSETAAGTAAKAVTLAEGQTFTLETNATAKIKFTNDNTAANPTLNIGGTGAKAIWWNGAAAPANLVIKNFIYDVKYDGTHYVIQNAVKRLTNNDFGVFRTSGDYATTYNSGSWNFSDWTLYYSTGIENSTWRGSHIGNIEQRVASGNYTYPILFSGTANATATTSTVPYFDVDVKINPSTSTIYAATFSGALSGNASTATKLATARSLKTKLDSTTAVTFDGSGAQDAIPVTGTLPIANGGTGATTRLNALKALTNEDVGSNANYFLTITTSWGKGGYTSVANAKTVLGLKSAAYTESSAYATSGHTHSYLPLSGGTMTGSLTQKHTGLVKGDAVSAWTCRDYRVIDNSGDSGDKPCLSWWRTAVGTDKKVSVTINAFKFADESTASASIGIHYPIDGDAYTSAPTPPTADNSTKIATTAFVKAQGYTTATGHTHSYLPLAGGTVTGTLTLSRTTDASGTADNKPALIVGGASTAAHIEIDPNEILAKTDGTTVGTLNLNTDGGLVSVGVGGIKTTGAMTVAGDHSVIKSGLFISGAKQNYAIAISTDAVTKGTAPSATANSAIEFYGKTVSKYQNRLGLIENTVTTANVNTMKMVAYNATSAENTGTCAITCNVNAEGTAYTSAPTPATADNSTKIATTAFVKAQGYITSSGTASNVSGTVAIANGGTGATTRLNAIKALTNENVSTNATHFLGLKSDWSKVGYFTLAEAKTLLGLKSAAYTESSAYATSGHTHSYLPLSGGTMTGSITLTDKSILFDNSTLDYNAAPSANVTQGGLYWRDKNDNYVARMLYYKNTDKTMGMSFGMCRHGTTNSDGYTTLLGMSMNADGSVKYASCPTPAAGDNSTKIATTAWVTTKCGDYVPLSGGTVTGTLILSKTQDADAASNSKPALIVGGSDTAAHMEIDANEVMAKGSGTTTAPLYLNAGGGDVYIGGNTANYKSVTGRGKGSASLPVYTDADGIVTACGTSLGVSITGTAAKATGDVDGNAIKTTYAKLASPALTGTPTAPTAALGTNTTQIATTAFVYQNAARIRNADTTIYVAQAAAGDGSGSSAANAMSTDNMWKYLASVIMIPAAGSRENSKILTIKFVPNGTTSYGNITFDANKMPGVRNLVIDMSGTTATTTSNYTTNCPTFGNINAFGGPLHVTIKNVYSTGTIQAEYHARISINTFVGASRFVAANYGRFDIASGTYAIKNAGTDYLCKGTDYGQMIVVTKTANFHFMEQCYFSGGIYFSDTNGRTYIRHDYIKLTGTKPIVACTASGTKTGTSATAAGTAAKAVTLAEGQTFTLANNAVAYVTFDNTNTAANPTLNINSTGAKPIYFNGAAIPKAYLNKHVQYKFTYNGTQYVCNNTFNRVEVAGVHSFFQRNGAVATTYNSGTFNWDGYSTSFTNGANVAGALYSTTAAAGDSSTRVATTAFVASKFHFSTSAPSDSSGADGDVWYQYV